MRRISALTALVILISCWAVPARADAQQLQLSSYSVSPVVLLENQVPVRCDGANFFGCGYVAVQAELSGLAGTTRPPSQGGFPPLNAGGSARVARSYGCQSADGTRLRRYDRTVVERVTLNTRRGQPLSIPEGDTLTLSVFAFLLDAQPGNCPRGARATMYQFEVKQVRLELESRWAPLPSATYRLPGRAVWVGAVPTPTPVPVPATR